MSFNRLDDNQILLAVLTNGTYAEAARVLGVSKQTISRRMKDEELKYRVAEYRKNILDAVNSQLLAGASRAVEVLVGLLESESEISQYNAASKILSLVQDFIESENIIAEIDRLRTEVEHQKMELVS